jgi:hypothetical protein
MLSARGGRLQVNEFREEIFGKCEQKPLLGTKQPRRSSGGSLADLAVPRHEARTTDTRGDDRHRLSGETVSAIHRRKRHEVELINLSGGGAMVSGDLVPKLWDRIDLDFGETGRIETAVRWVKDGRIGLEFAHETHIDCSPEERSALLREVLQRCFADIGAPVHSVDHGAEEAPQASAPDSADDGRAESRHPLIWSGMIRLKGHEAEVRLRNISSRGALIESEITLFADTRLLLDLGKSGSLAATVAWAVGDQAGLLFDAEFDLQLLAASQPSVAPIEWDAPTYLRNAAKDSPWEQGWGRASLEELASSLEGFLKR